MKTIYAIAAVLLSLLSACASTPGTGSSNWDDNVPPPPEPQAQAAARAAPVAAAAPAPRAQGAARPSYPAPYADGPMTPIAPAQVTARVVAEMAPPADLWERIRRGYAMPNLESDLVREREQWYGTRPDYLQRMTERSRKYLFHIVEELERRNMPTELALLPFIESAFNPQAVSSAKAAGMWQFIPSTGKSFDLKQNAFRDDRRDVLASTRAALDYLQKLHGMFGDWHLALAAYNWGEGSVGRAIAKNKRAGLGTGYPDLIMPAETRLYVPKLQAVKNIVAAPQSFAARLPLIENHPYFQSVTIARDIDVVLAAKLADVALEDFRALNPSANRPVILAAGTPQVLLPWDNAAIFQTNLQSYDRARLASWTAWTVPTAMKPAEAARRVGMSEADLRSVNQIPANMQIRAGSSLLVPRSLKIEHDVAEHVAENGQLSLSPDVVLRRSALKAGRHDSVASVAKRYRVSAAAVADWNKLSSTASFRPGQQIVLFLPGKPGSARKVAARSTKPAAVRLVKSRKPAPGARTAQAASLQVAIQR